MFWAHYLQRRFPYPLQYYGEVVELQLYVLNECLNVALDVAIDIG